MAEFSVSKGNSTNLPSTKTDGRMYYTTDNNKIYIDTQVSCTIIADGSSTTYSLTKTMIDIDTVTINGNITTSYVFDNGDNTITFNTAPTNGAKIVVTDSNLSRKCVNEALGNVGITIDGEKAIFSATQSGSSSGSGNSEPSDNSSGGNSGSSGSSSGSGSGVTYTAGDGIDINSSNVISSNLGKQYTAQATLTNDEITLGNDDGLCSNAYAFLDDDHDFSGWGDWVPTEGETCKVVIDNTEYNAIVNYCDTSEDQDGSEMWGIISYNCTNPTNNFIELYSAVIVGSTGELSVNDSSTNAFVIAIMTACIGDTGPYLILSSEDLEESTVQIQSTANITQYHMLPANSIACNSGLTQDSNGILNMDITNFVDTTKGLTVDSSTKQVGIFLNQNSGGLSIDTGLKLNYGNGLTISNGELIVNPSDLLDRTIVNGETDYSASGLLVNTRTIGGNSYNVLSVNSELFNSNKVVYIYGELTESNSIQEINYLSTTPILTLGSGCTPLTANFLNNIDFEKDYVVLRLIHNYTSVPLNSIYLPLAGFKGDTNELLFETTVRGGQNPYTLNHIIVSINTTNCSSSCTLYQLQTVSS